MLVLVLASVLVPRLVLGLALVLALGLPDAGQVAV